jgi:uncharacterized membrane protein
MSDEPGASRLRTAAFVLAAAAIPVPVLAGALTLAILHQLNPREATLAAFPYGVEVTIAMAVAALGVITAITAVFTLLARRDRTELRYPALVIQLQIGFAIAVLALLLLTPGVVG